MPLRFASCLVVVLAAFSLSACKGDDVTKVAPATASADGHVDAAAPSAAAPDAAPAAAGSKKGMYEVKSGVLELTNSMSSDMKQTLYFDDYGAKQATYTLLEMKMMGQVIKSETITIEADGWQIEYDAEKKTGTKRKMLGPKAGPMPDIKTLSAKDRAEYKMVELPAKTIAGKECKGYGMDMMGMKMKAWTWSNLPMYSETQMGSASDKPMVVEVKSLQVDVPVPADKFKVPEGIALTEI